MVLTVVLSGKFCSGRNPNPKTLSDIKAAATLTDLKYNEDSIEIIGSAVDVEKAIRLIAERDLLLPDFSRTRGDLKNKRIKRLMREAKTSVFEGLIDKGKPKCWGEMPWRFITPLTLRKHMESMTKRMNACYKCANKDSNLFSTCSAFSSLRVEHERKWMED